MSHNKNKITVSVDLGCAGLCKRPKLSKIFNPKPYSSHLSPSSTTNPSTPSTFSPSLETPALKSCFDHYSSTMVRGFGRVGGESVAVEKDSDDPYLDFRHSMLHMILEKERYSKDDLRKFLNCFLQLNSPFYHGIIVKAFTEIWNAVFSVKSGGGDGKHRQWQLHHHHHFNSKKKTDDYGTRKCKAKTN